MADIDISLTEDGDVAIALTDGSSRSAVTISQHRAETLVLELMGLVFQSAPGEKQESLEPALTLRSPRAGWGAGDDGRVALLFFSGSLRPIVVEFDDDSQAVELRDGIDMVLRVPRNLRTPTTRN